MPSEHPIRGSGDVGAAKAPEHGVEMETEVAVTADELSLHPDVVNGVELPQPEEEFHTVTPPTTTPVTSPTTTDSWLVIHTYLCVK